MAPVLVVIISIACIAIAGLLICVWLWLSKTMLFIQGASGFQTIAFHKLPQHRPIDRDQLTVALRALLKGTGITDLHIAAGLNPLAEVVSFGQLDEEFGLSMDFLPLRDLEKIARAEEAFQKTGWTLFQRNHWNVGLGPDVETLTLAYVLPKEEQSLRQGLALALRVRGLSDDAPLFALGSDYSEFPSDDRWISVFKQTDPLDKIFGRDR